MEPPTRPGRLKLLDRLITRSSDPLAIYSVCLPVQVFGTTWVEAQEAVERLDLLDSAELPLLHFRLCGDCVEIARGLEIDAPGRERLTASRVLYGPVWPGRQTSKS